MTLSISPAHTPQLHCPTGGLTPGTPTPLDTDDITETIDTILDRCSAVPSPETSARRHKRLRAYLRPLASTMAERISVELREGNPSAELLALALLFIQDKATAALPGDPELAHDAVRDLARHCRTLLRLTTEHPADKRPAQPVVRARPTPANQPLPQGSA
ncbi:DUF6415 family natural product biosynthesis protein [Streptomyces sp. ASQP_92]|uniref:DUF6415 family natural product biosynthesis protein n=1 Tax=Streptomyces sp. ASQP_92 TaxID=2979116 RepID=UPI0021C22310|nr:DUF6415 family natural product biosynthesis protein [Streptomyces sp. ASQP_92]MCT9093497.1 DUF6415 family natural product biosynthesis protein [Streptomyces sp. ASQP_92]